MRLTLLTLSAVSVGIAACGGDQKGTPTLDSIEAGTATRVEALSTVGIGTVEIAARTVNSYRVAVPAGNLFVSLTSSALEAGATTLEIDASLTGVARASLPADHAGRTDFSISSVDGSLEADAGNAVGWTFSLEPSAFGAGTASLLGDPTGTPSFSAAGTHGVAVSMDDEVWWHSDTPGAPPYVVADMPQSVAGMVSGHLDRDGILDLAVWSGNQLVALRGLAEGGYTWGGAWQASEGEVIGASISDANGDRLTDLSIGTSGNGNGVVTVLLHDGAWRFDPLPELNVNTEMYSLTVGDEAGDGSPDVSIFATVTGTIRRYTLAEEGWVGAPTSELPGYESLDGGNLLPQSDLDGDGVLETIIRGSADANTQELVFFVIDPEGAGSINYPDSYGLYEAAVSDLNVDGRPEIIISEDGDLTVVGWDGEKFQSRTSSGLGDRGPVAGGDASGDGVPDVIIASDAVRVHVGQLDEEGIWTRNRFEWLTYGTYFEASMKVTDLNNDGIADFVGLEQDPDTGDVDVVAWTLSFDSVSPEIQPLGRANLVTSGVGHDIAVCDGDIYALSEGIDDDTGTTSSSIRLSLVRFSSSVGAFVVSERSIDRGSMLDCGLIDDGQTGVVVSSQTGTWTTFGGGLAEVGSGDVGVTEDIAIGDINGDGFGEVVGCTGETLPCSIAMVDVDGDGIEDVVRSHDATTLTILGVETELAGRGILSSGDVDGDGMTDIMGWDAENGLMMVWRNVGTTLAPPMVLHTDRILVSPPALADMTGDGVPELVFVGDDRKMIHSSPTVAAIGATW